MLRGMGCPDKPVSKISEDLFDVSSYVDGLCSFVRSCDTPMTISIQGDWGSGKTSMMNMMREKLESTICPIWFNTWQFSQFNMGNSLVFSMMNVLLDELDSDNVVIKKIIGSISGFTRNVIRVATDRVAGGAAESMVSDALSGEPTDAAKEIRTLKEEFQKAINKKLEKEHKDRVVVFVDDLDRLQPIKAIELLEALKIFLDCEKCVFILAVDYEVVTLGIKEKFGDNVSEEKGRSFFDKIIQLPFKMPVAQYNVEKYVKDMMKRMSVYTSDIETNLYTNLIKTSVGYNPRSMKRLFNTFQLLDIVSDKSIADIDINVKKRVLFATVCAQMSFEEFYLYLVSSSIDSETLSEFSDNTENSSAFTDLYPDDDSDAVDKKIKKLSSFLPYFISAIKSGDTEKVTDADVDILDKILKCSVITSVNAVSSDEDTDMKDKYRKINKKLVDDTNEILSKIDKFERWTSRTKHGDVKLCDISGYCDIDTSNELKVSLGYYVTRLGDHIAVHIYIYNQNKRKREDFFNTLGGNPLDLKTKPIKDPKGIYKYMNILSFDDTDTKASEDIAAEVEKAYNILEKI